MAFLSNRKPLLVFVGDGTREGAVEPVVKGGWGDGPSPSDGAESSGSLRFIAGFTEVFLSVGDSHSNDE